MLNNWPFWARQDQLPPAGDWTIWLLLGGRGAGKTRAGAEWIRHIAQNSPRRIALIGETYQAARDVMVEGASGLLTITPDNEKPRFFSSRRRLEWPCGSVAELFSAEDPDALRGPQFHAAWGDEICKWRYDQKTWDMLQFALRLGAKPRQCITTTPRPTKLIKSILARSDCIAARASSHANRNNLSPVFFEAIVGRYENTRLGRQELNAELIEDEPNGLWNRAMIDFARLNSAPPLERTVIAIDPPASAGRSADECGIIAAGCSAEGHAYVLEDCSAAGLSPVQWAKRALAALRRHRASRLVAEINQGGNLVENVIRQIAPDAAFRAVRASKSKHMRAEPVAALYEQGRVHHIGNLPKLEDQMCAFDGEKSNGRSPDRMDALVWALTDLIINRRANQARLRQL